MDIIVQKYGGTSVANKDALNCVICKIAKARRAKKKIVVVVSAQGKTTDSLISLASSHVLDNTKYPKEMDMLLATGELQTVALLTMMLKEKGYDAIGMSGEQAGIISNSNFSNASIQRIMTDNIINHLKEDRIVIVAGFQANDKYGNITTLGRGGSDLSAVALASELKAKRCEIYTDVDGVYSGEPKTIQRATLLKRISYNEMLEASTLGAKVLHNRCIGIAKDNNMNIVVKNTFNNSSGTIVSNSCKNSKKVENYQPKIIVSKDGFSKISLLGEALMSNPNIIHKIYEIVSSMNEVVHMINISEISINIIVSSKSAKQIANKLHDELILKTY